MQQPQLGHVVHVAVDAARERIRQELEVECAIETVITFAFGSRQPMEELLPRIRATLPVEPTVLQVIDAVFAAHRERGPIADEAARRADAGMAMAAFLSADPHELGIPAALFRVGSEVWLTPARARLS
jgi:hypothetical protein